MIDEEVVLAQLEQNRLNKIVIDVWENEPAFNPDVAKQALFATPHIAGYSVQSKRRASEMIIRQFCENSGIDVPKFETEDPYMPELNKNYSSLKEILLELHPIGWFDKKMRELMQLEKNTRAESFGQLRSESPLRHEYTNMFIDDHHLSKFPELMDLGIRSI